jgi:multidrug resistance efflux pump
VKRKHKFLWLIFLIFSLSACGQNVNTNSENESLLTQEEYLNVYGDVKVDRSQEFVIDFPSKIETIFINDGDLVKKGDKLIALDLKDYLLEIQLKENEVQILESQLKKLSENSNPLMPDISRIQNELRIKENYLLTGEDPDLIPLKNRLEIIEKAIAISQQEYEANQELFEMGAITEKELKQSEQIYKSNLKDKEDTLMAIEKVKSNRRIEIDGLKTQLESISRQAANTDKQKLYETEELSIRIESAKLQVNAMKSKLNRAFIQDNYIVAPEDNLIIYDIYCKEGSRIGPEQALLKAMYQDTMMVIADIPEESISLVSAGAEAIIVPPYENGEEITGRIRTISNRAVEKDGDIYLEAIIDIEKGKELLKPGMTVDIKIPANID